MEIVFCRGCGKEIHTSAISCPHCGAPQINPASTSIQNNNESMWVPIASLVLGIICVLMLFDDSDWDKYETRGFFTTATVAFVLGVHGSKQMAGKSMAITGVILSLVAATIVALAQLSDLFSN